MRCLTKILTTTIALSMLAIPVCASETLESTESEMESSETLSEELVDILINPYVLEIQKYNKENDGIFTIYPEGRWDFWCANYEKDADNYEEILESLAAEIPEAESQTEDESPSFNSLTEVPQYDESLEAAEVTRNELLLPCEKAIENVNKETGSKFKIEDEYAWEAFYHFAGDTQDEIEKYLTEEYKKEKKDISDTFIENLVKDETKKRDEELKPYLEAISQAEKETGVEILYTDSEKWLMAVTLTGFTQDELSEYLVKQLDAGIVHFDETEGIHISYTRD